MYIFDPNNPGDGHHVDVPATTMKGDANASLLSAWHMVKRMGYTLTLTPDGKTASIWLYEVWKPHALRIPVMATFAAPPVTSTLMLFVMWLLLTLLLLPPVALVLLSPPWITEPRLFREP